MCKWFCLTALLALSVVPLTRARADDDDPDTQTEFPEGHADCTFFGPQRARFLKRGELQADQRAAVLAEITNDVAGALPPTPSRGRSGALQEAASLAGIDQILFAAMSANGVTPADPATDQEFLRRVTLDLTGRIPVAQDVQAFLADPTPSKRAALVDSLLNSPAWVDKWTMFFGDLFKNTARNTQVQRYPDGRDAFYTYIKSSLTQNKPYNQIATDLITATGDNSFQQGELNFLVGAITTGGPAQDTIDTGAAQISEMFLGLAHMNCLLCHDGRRHLDSLSLWGSQAKRMQAWGMASFLSHTAMRRQVIMPGANIGYYSVLDNVLRDYQLNTTTGNRPARQPAAGQPNTVAPVYIFDGGKPGRGENYRVAFAREITSDFQFARASVNYVWRQFFGIGIVEPPDQFDPLRLDANNPPPDPWKLQPSNPQLLQKLAKNFVASGYDVKAIMREIVNSRAYQLSARYSGTWNPAWDRLYARKLVRRLDAEEIHDALVQSSGIPVSYNLGTLGAVQWVMQVPEPSGMPPRGPIGFLDSFLRGNRDDEDRSRETSVVQALNLMNDPFVLARLPITASSLLGRSINQADEQLVDTLYLNALSRYPTESERGTAVNFLRSGNRNQKAQGLLWSLYNKVDFIFNY